MDRVERSSLLVSVYYECDFHLCYFVLPSQQNGIDEPNDLLFVYILVVVVVAVVVDYYYLHHQMMMRLCNM